MTVVKICGIRTLDEALAAVEAGADYLGFNFYPKSPRYIAPTLCASISLALDSTCPQVRRVGVFVNAPLKQIQDTMQTCRLDLAQLHGDEDPELFRQLAPAAYKAFRGVPDELAGFQRDLAPAALIDASVADRYGGTGALADWTSAAHLASRVPLFLAGGLTPENVAAAVRQVRPWGVDVASGVEARPGKKDTARMHQFVTAVCSAERES